MTETVKITGICDAPDSSTILLPQGTEKSTKPYLLLTGANDAERIVKFSARTGPGDSACVSAGLLEDLGGEGTAVTYRGISKWGRVRRGSMLRLQLLIAVLTLIGAGISAYSAWIKSGGETSTPFDQSVGVTVFIIASLLAWLKFAKELEEL